MAQRCPRAKVSQLGKKRWQKKSAPRFGRYTQILIIEKRSWYRPLSLIITNIMSTQ